MVNQEMRMAHTIQCPITIIKEVYTDNINDLGNYFCRTVVDKDGFYDDRIQSIFRTSREEKWTLTQLKQMLDKP